MPGSRSGDSLLENVDLSYYGALDDKADSTVSSFFENAPSVSLTWEDLNVSVANKRSLVDGIRGRKKEAKQILFDVTGAVGSGQLLALMGASGAGKTTLLNALNHRNSRGMQIQGRILVNGRNLGRGITAVSAYVQQDDLFIPELTVWEHLVFQAQLRLPDSIPRSQKLQRALAVLQDLGLGACRNTRIGDGQGISGGERKRLAFASETLTNPPIFFCDEPTTGLDSFLAQQVVELLQKMARKGKTIICTIHQPTSEVYAMFDRILLLAEGRTAFLGQADAAIKFFGSLDFVCPSAFNPADFYIQTLAVAPGHPEQSRQRLTSIADAYDDSIFAREVRRWISGNEKSEKTEDFQNNSLYKVGWYTQFFVLLFRATLHNYRNRRLVLARLIQKLIIGVFVGLLYLQLPLDQTSIMSRKGAIFYLLIQTSMPAVMGTLRFLPAEFPIVLREHHDGTYKVSSYYWSKVVSFIPVWSTDGILFICIAYFLIGLRSNPEAFFLFLLTGVLMEQCSSAFGTLIAAATPSFNVALTLAGPLLTIIRMTGGLLANVGTLPVFISWIQYLSWWRYGYEAVSVIQWHGVRNITCNSGNLACVRTGDEVLKSLSFNPAFLTRDIAMIFCLCCVFYTAGYVALWIRIYRAR